MVWSPIRTSQKQPCPASHSQGRHRHGWLQWLYCGQEAGSKLSSVITAFVCVLAGQSLGNVFPICHRCTSGVTSTHASHPPFAELTWVVPPPQLWDGFPSTCCGVFSALPGHDPLTCLPCHFPATGDQQLTHDHRKIRLSGPEFTPDVQAMQKEKKTQ